jgi:hypothetical protein
MTSTIKVNNVQNQCGQNIINENSNTITIGASGDTIELASGASQTGFGRTGTVDWDTTAKTASFTAVSGTGYFVNTTSTAVTVTLPASPSAGDIVSIKDYAYTFATNNLTVARNGSPIGGGTGDNPVYATNGTVLTFIYVDGTKGWLVINESTDTSEAVTNTFITATGGTITCCGDYKIHTFTGPGTFCVSAGEGPVAKVDYLVVAGGSAGGLDRGGGGGAGGFRESIPSPAAWTASPLANPDGALPVSVQGYPVTVGAGGSTSNTSSTLVPPGSNSIFSTIISTGGGGAGNPGGPGFVNGRPGGSGGGTRDDPATGGTGNTPPVSPPQGTDGGSSSTNHNGPGGGGGGATEAGFDGAGNPTPATFGDGGDGAQTSISGTATYYAGGGGSGGGTPIPAGGEGGQGGGGNGANLPGSAQAGTANTGGGGGAGNGGPCQCAAAGGSGIVIIRYKYQ